MSLKAKDLKTSGTVKKLAAQRIVSEMLMPQNYVNLDETTILVSENKLNYGILDTAGHSIEPIYDFRLRELEGTNGSLHTLDFVADQFTAMKRKYEELSRKNGKFGFLKPKRALIRGDKLYSNHINEFLMTFVRVAFVEKKQKIVNFNIFCKEFIRFIRRTRATNRLGGLPVSKTLFYSSSNTPINASGLVIDFEDDSFGDDEKKQEHWFDDENFLLYCDAARNAGFYVDLQHPYRLIANIASKKMQRAAEYNANTIYLPGYAGNIFQQYYHKVCVYDFITIKDKLLQVYSHIVANRPTVDQYRFCASGALKTKKALREFFSLEYLQVPPIPGRPKENMKSLLGTAATSSAHSTLRYGWHTDKYNIIYFMKLYVNIRYYEIDGIKEYLTEKEKNAIVIKAAKKLRQGDVEGAFLYIGSQFKSFRFLDH